MVYVLGIEPRPSRMLGKHFTNWAISQASENIYTTKSGMMAYNYNPRTWEVEAGRSGFKAILRYIAIWKSAWIIHGAVSKTKQNKKQKQKQKKGKKEKGELWL